nr:endonuclease domain-containing protein [Planomonospora venezuelensis]
MDLLWRDERCVVEIDGPDHRTARKYAQDRQRDIRLQQAGYAVLRFTDDQVMTDMEAVLRQVEWFVRNRRHGTPKG